MKVTAIHRPDDPTSLQIYYERMTSELTTLGIEIIPILEDTIISSNYDLAWDPGMCMRPLTENILTCPIPVIGTMHGVKAYSLPLRELVNSKEEEIELLSTKEILDKQWFKFKKKISALITVSNYGKNEVISALKIRPQKVHVVYNGVDADIFNISKEHMKREKPYFLHISSVNPIKNFNRLLLAYLNLPELTRPDLVAVIPEHNQKINIPGLYIISEKLEQYELAKWYRGALAFILPSLRETFGLTIVEAMSCGTPVITSNVTGCAEISGNAAYLINPRSVNDITKAMSKFINNNFLCEKLRLKGLDQVEQFSWKISAIKLVNIFRYVTQKRISIVKN